MAAVYLILVIFKSMYNLYSHSSGFRFQYPRHFVGDGGCGIFLEMAGHDKDGIAHVE